MPDDLPTNRLDIGLRPDGTDRATTCCNDFAQETRTVVRGLRRSARRPGRSAIDGRRSRMIDASSPLPFTNRAVLEQPIDGSRRRRAHRDAAPRVLRRPAGDAVPARQRVADARPASPSGSCSWVIRRSWSDRRTSRCPPPPAGAAHRAQSTDDRHCRRLRTHAHRRLSRADAAALRTRCASFTPDALDAPRAGITSSATSTTAPVATGSSYVGDQLVRVDNIATLDGSRGRGYGLAITAAAIAADLAKTATLIASDLGRPVYERLGFVAMLAGHLLDRQPLSRVSSHTPNFASRTIATASSGRRRSSRPPRPCVPT